MATSTSAKNVETSATKSLQTELGNIKAKKTLQLVILGGPWAAFGEGLGRSGASLGHSWAALGSFGGVRKRAFLHHRSKMVSQRPSKWILGRFGQGLGRVWEGWARVLEGFGSSFLRPPRCLANSLGITMRGGPSPGVVGPCPSWKFWAKALQRGVRGARRGCFANPSWAPSWLHWAPRWLQVGFCFGCVFSRVFQKIRF